VKLNRRLTKGVAILAAAAACVSTLFAPGVASAATLTSLTLTPSDATKGQTSVSYTIAIASSSAAAKCVRVHFSSSTTFSGTLPSGMTFTSPSVTANPGAVTMTASSTSDYVQGTSGSGPILTSLVVTGIKNTTTAGTVYAYIETWGNTDCSTGGVLDTGTVATAITDNTIVSVTVDPSFTFTVANQASACNGESNFVGGAGSSTGVALGHLAVSSSATGGQLLTVSGNSGGGYAVYLRGTQATTNLRSTGHNWVDGGGTYASPAVIGAGERFAYTYHDNVAAGTVSNPVTTASNGAGWVALDNATTNSVMDADSTASSGTGCVSYNAQTGSSTPAGLYQATIIYTAVPVY
jgi:hypothetical protein